MTYLPTYTIQTHYFIYSLILGLIIGMIYDALRLIRETVNYNKKPKLYLSDILIFVIAAFSFEIYTLAFGYGEIRGYALLGMVLGFTFYFYTIGSVFYRIEKRIAFIMNIPIIFFIKTLKKLHLLVYNCCVVFIDRFKIRRTGEQSEEGEEKQ